MYRAHLSGEGKGRELELEECLASPAKEVILHRPLKEEFSTRPVAAMVQGVRCHSTLTVTVKSHHEVCSGTLVLLLKPYVFHTSREPIKLPLMYLMHTSTKLLPLPHMYRYLYHTVTNSYATIVYFFDSYCKNSGSYHSAWHMPPEGTILGPCYKQHPFAGTSAATMRAALMTAARSNTLAIPFHTNFLVNNCVFAHF